MQSKWARYWVFQAIGWGSFALINTFFAFSFDRLNGHYYYRLAVFLFLGILVSHLMRAVIIRLGILQKSLNTQVLQFFLLTFLLAIAVSFVNVEIANGLDLLREDEVNLLSRTTVSYWLNKMLLVLSNGFSYFVLLFIWSLIYFMYHYVSKSRKQQLDTLRLESLVKELELQTIKAHINPHFIFNSLNSIRALVDENPQRARKAVTELSNILRSSMQTEKKEAVPFENELMIVKDYLALEKMRFEDRLKIEYQIDENTLFKPVPPMMLQTLVENAIKHGISQRVEGGWIKVLSKIDEGYHAMTVQNSGQLGSGCSQEKNTEFLSQAVDVEPGFGISSTTSRLHLLYGDSASFAIRQINGSAVEVKVKIPLQDDVCMKK